MCSISILRILKLKIFINDNFSNIYLVYEYILSDLTDTNRYRSTRIAYTEMNNAIDVQYRMVLNYIVINFQEIKETNLEHMF